MKVKKVIFFFFVFLPLPAVLISLQFLPEQIPAHFDLSGQVTRWGSKYETLLFPILALAFGLFLWAMIRYAAKQEAQGKNNQSISLTASIFCLLLLNVLTGYALFTSFRQSETLSFHPLDLYQIESALAGIFLLLIGNKMPKLRYNSVIGLRTPWSMKNQTTWKKCQRFGGISFLVAGILMAVSAFLIKGYLCPFVTLGILLLSTVISTVYSFRVSKKY